MTDNSVILSLVFALWQKFTAAYYDSWTSKFIKRLSNLFKELLSYSGIWNFIKRESYLSRVFEHSLLLKFISWLVNLPSKLCGKIYSKFETLFLDSGIFRIIKVILSRFDILIGICLTVIIIVPHKYWNNVYSTAIVFALVLLYALKAAYDKDEYFNIKALDFTLILFMAAILMAVVTSVFPKESFRFLIFYLTSFLITLLIVSAVKTGRSMNMLLQILSLGIAVTGVYGIWQAIIGVPIDVTQVDINISSNLVGRIYSTVGNPNNYAEIIILTVPFMLALVFNTGGLFNKFKFSVLIIFPIIALVLTGARISQVAFAFSILVFIFLKNRKLIPAAIVSGILCYPLLPQWVINRVQTIANPNDTSIEYRLKIYKTVAPMLKDFWVTGVGLGTGKSTDPFMVVVSRYFLWTKDSTIPVHTQNLFLQIWLEAGIIGIVTFLWFMARIVKKSLINIFNKKDEYINNILIAGVSSLAGIAPVAVAEHIWFYPRVMLFFWADIGIILASLSILAKKQIVSPDSE